jgi:hypothetical protein
MKQPFRSICLIIPIFFLFFVTAGAQDFSLSQGTSVVQNDPANLDEEIEVHYDGPNNDNGVGAADATFIIAARFTSDELGAYVGNGITKVRVYIRDATVGNTGTLKLYAAGTSTEPGAEIYSQVVTTVENSWNEYVVSPYITVPNADLWVGLEATAGSDGFQYWGGVDAGPNDPDGQWIYFSGAWATLVDLNPALTVNWNIRAVVDTDIGGSTIYFEDFDAMVSGGQVACQDPVNWNTWNDNPCDPTTDAYVSSNYAFSGANSAVIVADNDLVKPLGTQTSGKWYMSFMVYIPTGKSGYFNTMNEWTLPATFVWGMDCFFDVGGAGRLDTQGGGGGGTVVDFDWTVAEWNQVVVIVDLDISMAEFWIGTDVSNFTQIATWDWTDGGTKPNTLDANDFYGGESTDEMYFDDYYFGDAMPPIVPVELTSFAASVTNLGQVMLNWETATEINNQGFEIERRTETSEYRTVGFVEGFGTTTEQRSYSYLDQTAEQGVNYYRLKQVDFDGSFEYSDEIEVDVTGPLTFNLDQNYPNPFNPSTNINFSIPESGNVRLAVYNLVGEEVAILVDGFRPAGFYEATFNASNLPSGVYLYKLQSANSVQTKKMMLLK